MFSKGRIAREKKTVETMIRIYCNQKHDASNDLCPSCQELLQYAKIRLDKCKFGENKPTCGKCAIHCYKQDMRAKITDVMRFSGPKMITHHPMMAIKHLIDGWRK